MSNIRNLKTEVNVLKDMKSLLETYQEIAATRMRKSKTKVLINREFFEGLNDLYHTVFVYYKLLLKKMHLKTKFDKNTPFMKTNGKTVSVWISTSTGLYGDIVGRTFDLFTRNIDANSSDVVIIGRYGMRMYEDYFNKRPYKFFDIRLPGGVEGDLREVAAYIVQYTNVIIYHGLFKTVLNQEPVQEYLTGELVGLQKTLDESSQEIPLTLSIFEPSIERLAEFFETEILSSLFDQSVNESNLSSLASRMISLHGAVDNAEKSIRGLNYNLKKEKHHLSNSKQQTLLSSVWASSIRSR